MEKTMMRDHAIIIVSVVLVMALAVVGNARPKYIRMENIDCCGGGGWEARDYNDDGSYTSVFLCDGGGVC
jgi:hypothetical protein